jgi:NADH:ubiquinone oxidoreductase subunit 3 (subunit A)
MIFLFKLGPFDYAYRAIDLYRPSFHKIGYFYSLNYYHYIIYNFIFFFCFVTLLSLIAYFVSPRSFDIEKNSPYECGFNPFDDAREPFEIQFYLVSILFIIFDLEISFLIPWVVVFRFVGLIGLNLMLFFFILLSLGFLYEFYKGALDWD